MILAHQSNETSQSIRSLRTHRHHQRFPNTQRDTKQSTHDMLREHHFHFALHKKFVKHRFHLWAGAGAGAGGLGPGLGAWLSASSLLPATSLRWPAPPARALRQSSETALGCHLPKNLQFSLVFDDLTPTYGSSKSVQMVGARGLGPCLVRYST